MKKVMIVTNTRDNCEASTQDEARVKAAVARCVSPIDEEEAQLWDEAVERCTKAA